jgi:hypothetical protein
MVRPASRSSFLFEHDLFGKPDSTFPDHAPGSQQAKKSVAAVQDFSASVR